MSLDYIRRISKYKLGVRISSGWSSKTIPRDFFPLQDQLQIHFLNMYFSFVLLGVITVPLFVNSQQTPCCYKPPVSNCNCTCNANQDLPVILKTLETKLDRVESLIGLNNNNNSDLSDAVKSLEAKMEGLIALINNTSSFFPPRTPKPTANLQQKYELMLNS